MTLSSPRLLGDLVVYLRGAVGGPRELYVHQLATGVDSRLPVVGAEGTLLDLRLGGPDAIWIHGLDLGDAIGEGFARVDLTTGAFGAFVHPTPVLVRDWDTLGDGALFAGAGLFLGARVDGVLWVHDGMPWLALGEGEQLHELAMSPSGLAFVGTRLSSPFESVYVQTTAGGCVTTAGWGDGSVTFSSPTWVGGKLASVRSSQFTQHVWVWDPATDNSRVVSRATGQWRIDGLAADAAGGAVFYVATSIDPPGEQGLWRASLAGGDPVLLTTPLAGRNYVLE